MKVYPWSPKNPPSVFAPYLFIMRVTRDAPQHIRDIERLTGITYSALRHMLPGLRAVGLIGVKGWHVENRARLPVYGWGFDEVPDAPAKFKPKANCIALASAWRAMHERMTVAELNEETGIGLAALRRFLTVAKNYRLAYIAEWRRSGAAHNLVAAWRLGSQSNAPRPAPVTRQQINAKHWQLRAAKRDHLRLIQAISAPLKEAA